MSIHHDIIIYSIKFTIHQKNLVSQNTYLTMCKDCPIFLLQDICLWCETKTIPSTLQKHWTVYHTRYTLLHSVAILLLKSILSKTRNLYLFTFQVINQSNECKQVYNNSSSFTWNVLRSLLDKNCLIIFGKYIFKNLIENGNLSHIISKKRLLLILVNQYLR